MKHTKRWVSLLLAVMILYHTGGEGDSQKKSMR